MKKILLPTDFSENSWNAIKYGLQLFKNENCKFYLLNTYSPVIYQVEYILESPAQYGIYDDARERSLKKLEKLKTRIKKEFNNSKHKIETLPRFNTLILELKDFVDSRKIDLIVMGTKGATATKEVLFGTNTVHTFKNVACPVLAVPEYFDFEKPLEVLFPTDYEVDYKSKHLDLMYEITKKFNSRLNILNATYGYELSEYQETNKLKLKTYFKEIHPIFHDISDRKVIESINEFQLETKVDLLVMIKNKHNFFEKLFFKNIINEIGMHLSTPFLVIPV